MIDYVTTPTAPGKASGTLVWFPAGQPFTPEFHYVQYIELPAGYYSSAHACGTTVTELATGRGGVITSTRPATLRSGTYVRVTWDDGSQSWRLTSEITLRYI